jgi:hypothetical protein
VSDLSRRFDAYLRSVRGFESVDTLLDGVHLEGTKRADYLLWNRSVIVEQKTLESDPSDKPQKFMDRLLEERRVLAYGNVSTTQVFSQLSDGEEQERRLARSITKGLEDSLAMADRQTRDTREIFALSDALGIVIVLNTGALTLDPALIAYGVGQAYGKRTAAGDVRYPHNDGVIVISGAHASITPKGPALPCIAGPTPHSMRGDRVREFCEEFVSGWAAFNGLPLT